MATVVAISSACLRKCLLYTLTARSCSNFSTASRGISYCKSLAWFGATAARFSTLISQRSAKMFHSAPSWLGVKASSLTVDVPSPKESVGCPICSRDLIFTYKDVLFLSQFLSPEGHILNRRVTGVCGKQQKKLEKAVKISRRLGLLPRCGHQSSVAVEKQRK